jgi:hypothetical protein
MPQRGVNKVKTRRTDAAPPERPARRNRFLFLSLLIFLAAFPSAAEESPGWNITAECQLIVLPQKLALPLLPDLNDEAKIERAFAKLQQLIVKGEAQLAAYLIARSNRDEKVSVESIEGFRYATEFDPPPVPWHAPVNPKILKFLPFFGAAPTHFEEREVGSRLDISASVRPGGGIIDMNVSVSHVRFLKWQKIDAGALPDGRFLSVQQPVFDTHRNETKVFLRNNERTLLGVHKLSTRPGDIELVLLKARAVPQP